MRVISVALCVLALGACSGSSVATTSGLGPTSEPGGPTTTPVETPAPETEAASVRSITVGGMGSEYVTPERCVIDIGVTSRRPTVEEATRAAAASGDALLAALQEAGVAVEGLQTSNFSVGPYHEGEYWMVAGYETSIGYRVTVPTVDEIGPILAAAVVAGGDDVRAWGIRFESDPTGLLEIARQEAWEDAEARAESLAQLAGEPLGRLIDAHEKVLVTSPQGMSQGGEGDSASFDIPVSPGMTGVVVLLTVTFEIGA